MTHASRNTTTGLRFEEEIVIRKDSRRRIDLTKYNLYKYLRKINKDYKSVISKKLLPDAAYYYPETGELEVFEKKYQERSGSADEKPQTCAFKLSQFKKIGSLIEATKVTYTYIFSEWFKRPEYKDMLEYIKSVDGCNYKFYDEI